jgi:hypothetical protein
MRRILVQLAISVLSIFIGLALSAGIGFLVGSFWGGMPGIIAFFVAFVILWITWSRTDFDPAMTYGARWADPMFRRGQESSKDE